MNYTGLTMNEAIELATSNNLLYQIVRKETVLYLDDLEGDKRTIFLHCDDDDIVLSFHII